MHKVIAITVSLALILGSNPIVNAASFPDTQGTTYETAFRYLSNKNVVHGYPDGSGRPEGPLNRAEALKVLFGLKGATRVQWYSKHIPPLPLFADIDQRAWYAPYVEAAFEAKMVTGYPDQTFRPGNLLSTEEAVTLLLRTYKISGTSGSAKLSPYIQNRDGEWFTPFINEAIDRNLIMHANRLELGSAISRGRFFDMVYRLDSSLGRGQTVFEGSEPVVYVNTNRTGVRPQQSSIAIHAEQPRSSRSPHASEKYFAISMPRLNVKDLTVTHPSNPFTADGVLEPLKYGVGHLFGYPGAGGKIMIYGHSSSYPWDVSQYAKIFRGINKLEVGDRVYVTYEDSLHTYEVTHKSTIDATDTTPFRDDGSGEELILYTCWPPDSIAQRYLVHALPVSSVALK